MSVLTVSRWGNTFMSKQSTRGGVGAAATNASSATRLQWALLLTLARSLRRHESCVRDFILLLGTDVHVPFGVGEAIDELGIVVVRISPLDPAIPPLDHLHAWRLTAYKRVVVLDSDMLAIRSIDNLFDSTRLYPQNQLIMGHHAYDKAQSICGLPTGRRGNGGLLMLRPDLHQFADALIHVQRGLACGGRGSLAVDEDVEEAHAHQVARAAGGGGGGGGPGFGVRGRTHNASALLEALRRGVNRSSAGTAGPSFAEVALRVQRALQWAQQLERLLLDPRGLELRVRPPPPPPPIGNESAGIVNASTSSEESKGNATVGWINPETGLPFVELRKRLLEHPCFKEEQTGLACLFNAHRRLRILPCPYSWDVGNGLHMHGKQHHLGCKARSGADEATCDRIAHHVASRCTWEHASQDAHIIHCAPPSLPIPASASLRLRNRHP